ncbi:M15 family metallopeptidase [Amphritea sp. HPY]|uniref:M15 family metallopeptidase n=1 Tax=Amphritea sp. HPY TaxID=3421652 RepID=UPI003D7D9AF6
MAKSYKLSRRSNSRLNTVHPNLRRVIRRAIEITKIDFGIPPDGGLRTADRQHELFLKKVSKCDGFHKKSYHQSGNAVDVYAYVDGKASWDEEHLAMVAAAVLQAASELQISIEWGGLWDYTDMPHFQLSKS